MEGISHEACSLAGTLGLGKLTVLYDDNGISIDGETQRLVHRRHRQALRGLRLERDPRTSTATTSRPSTRRSATAQAVTDRPTLICCKTVIGKGAPHKAGTAEAHGAALGEKEVAATRVALGWTAPAVRDSGRRSTPAGTRASAALRAEDAWAKRFAHYREAHPRARRRVHAAHARRAAGVLAGDGGAFVAAQAAKGRDRRHAQGVAAGDRGLREGAAGAPRRLGRPHRLGASPTGPAARRSPANAAGNYIHFGVREFAMCAIANGIALHGGFIPYVGTFLTFSDYARNALRMAALMKLRTIFVFTHDSIGLGEDGPTHQSVEHAASLRLIPNMDVWRPCDTVETAVAWAAAIERRDGPSCLAVHAPERAVPEARRRADRRHSPRRLRARRLERRGREARGDHRDRLRGRARDGRARSARRRRHRGARRVDALHERLRPRRTPRTGRACCRAACRASRSRPARPTAGTSTSARRTIRTARSSASTRSASRRRPACCSSISASPSENVAAAVRRVVA